MKQKAPSLLLHLLLHFASEMLNFEILYANDAQSGRSRQ